jgi:uncharacterized protein
VSRGDWIQTASGHKFFPLDPWPGDVFIEDIAHALSHLCRFGGHCRRFYSVAEHSVLLARAALPEHRLWALLHDAAEAYLLDLPRPIKRMFPHYQEAEQKIMRAIAVRFHLHLGVPSQVKALDRAILLDEREQNMAMTRDDWAIDAAPLGVRLQFWTPARARSEFLSIFLELGGEL